MLRLLVVLLLVVVFALGAALGYFNSQNVQFDYLFGSVQVRLVVLVVATVLVSALLTLLLCAGRLLGLAAELRRVRRELRNAETELKNLRNLPQGPGR
ncbi:MAG: DUF1049 domain-containing protein [Nevskia sp.]|nr:DUF1049 domain-containing protein [Nevskia sp.]